LNKVERKGLLKVRLYLGLAYSYRNFEDVKKAVVRAIECLDVVLNIDGQRFVQSDVVKERVFEVYS
jgi:hypothetical protein